jgi:hypothetical protein
MLSLIFGITDFRGIAYKDLARAGLWLRTLTRTPVFGKAPLFHFDPWLGSAKLGLVQIWHPAGIFGFFSRLY